jgi:cellulose synthase operon protein B
MASIGRIVAAGGALVMLALAAPSMAAPASALPPSLAEAAAAPADHADSIIHPRGIVPLSHFVATAGPLRMTDVAGESDLFIELAKTARIKNTVVDIHYTNSTALQAGRSSLAVRLNETTLAQVPLDPAQPVGTATIRLPSELWRAGYNKLTIAIVQHYTSHCEDPESPELWTEIDLSRSHLAYELEPASDSYLLSDLSGLFSPGLGGVGEVLTLAAPGAAADQLRRETLPLVAEALALRRQFAPLAVRYADWRESGSAGAGTGAAGPLAYLPRPDAPPGVHVLVGTPDQLARILPVEDLPFVDGPKLILSGVGGKWARLLVTGRSVAEVTVAARSLALMDDALTADQQVSFVGQESARLGLPLLRRVTMEGGGTYSFEGLGAPTQTFTGAGDKHLRVALPLPADFYTHEAAQADLSLDFGYGAGMGPGSVINMLINGEYVHGIQLDKAEGTAYRGYRVRLPVRLLVPGQNTLEFDIHMRPQLVGGECLSVKGRHLMVQFSGTSRIALPEAGHAAVLPDLARFASSGFPYVRFSHAAAGHVYVSSPELFGSALTLVGKLAQMAHAPVDGWQVESGLPGAIDGDAILLATPDKLPAEQFGNWSAAVGRTKKWPYRALHDLRDLSESKHLDLGDLASALRGQAQAAPAVAEALSQRSRLGGLGVLLAFRNPAAQSDGTLTVVAAETPEILAARLQELVQPELWSQVRGDLVAWQGLGTPPLTMQVAEHYEVGREDPWLLLRLMSSSNPWYWIGAALGATGLFALLATRLLARRRKQIEKGGR